MGAPVLNGLHAGANLNDAMHATTQGWMGWTTERQTSEQYGLSKGLPYLTDFVTHGKNAKTALAN